MRRSPSNTGCISVIIAASPHACLHDKQPTIFLFLFRYGKGDFVRGTVLIFLPGLPEIMELDEYKLMTEFTIELGYVERRVLSDTSPEVSPKFY